MQSLKRSGMLFIILLAVMAFPTVCMARSGGVQPSALLSASAPAVSDIKWVGKSVSLPEAGKVNMVIFWNGVYSSSINALVSAEKIYQKYGPQGLVVLGINDMGEDISVLLRVVSQKKISFSLGTGNGAVKAAELYGIRGVPAVILIDRGGNVVYVADGLNYSVEAELSSIIEGML